MIPWKYPSNFYCQKCNNTGYKPNGKSCKSCWERFARNKIQYVAPPPQLQQPGLHIPFTNLRFTDDFNVRSDTPTYTAVYPTAPPPISHIPPVPSVPPPQPLPPANPPPYEIAVSPNMGHYPPTPPPAPPVPMPPPRPQPFASVPRVVNPGDPSLGGVLCGRCRGKGYTGGFWLGEETCAVCGGVGRVFN